MKTEKNIFNESWCSGEKRALAFDSEAEKFASVCPDERQLDFLSMRYYNFIHFGVNTMNNREWGDGREDISRFNPAELDTDQWCRELKKTGSRGVIITAKHHDGFCLFDTKLTDHNVMNTPFGKDIVRMLSESCKKYGLKLGIYLSPWDRHESSYGTAEYNDFFVAQLKEVCTNYGELFCLWFDGACGEGKNGKKQVYDWERYYSVIRELQPKAVITICGPDVRWIGNEGGQVRKSEWSVIPVEKDSNDLIMENSQTDENQLAQMAENLNEKSSDLGSRQVLRGCDNLAFKPAEADVSINLGWFWHNSLYYAFKKKRTPEHLAEIFFNTVGGNASMLLNVPPDKRGLINKREVKSLERFAQLIKAPFENPVTDAVCAPFVSPEEKGEEGSMALKDGEKGFSVTFGGKSREVSALFLEEELRFGQRVEEFEIYCKDGQDYMKIYDATVIGSGKIIRFRKPVQTTELVILITQSRTAPVMKSIKVFG